MDGIGADDRFKNMSMDRIDADDDKFTKMFVDALCTNLKKAFSTKHIDWSETTPAAMRKAVAQITASQMPPTLDNSRKYVDYARKLLEQTL